MKAEKKGEPFYGTTCVGEKGQVVIPIEARERMGLKKGDKLLVFGLGCDMVALAKPTQLEKMAQDLSAKLEGIQKALDS